MYLALLLMLRYKRLVPLPLSGRRASANLVPIPPVASNLFGSSFALRRIPQLDYRGEGKALFGYFWRRLTDHSYVNIILEVEVYVMHVAAC